MVENCFENLNPHEAIAVAFMIMPAEHWQTFMRYDTATFRKFFKTLEALQKLQRTRQLRQPAQSKVLIASAGAAHGGANTHVSRVATHGDDWQLSDYGIRFVLQAAQVMQLGVPTPAESNESAELARGMTSVAFL